MKKLLILSGKGGTGKTTTSAAFIQFAQARAFADCDVDAPNLHLVQAVEGEPEAFDYLGSEKASIDPELCTGCGACADACRFGAIRKDGDRCRVDPYACEGCGVCAYMCPQKAVELHEDVAGQVLLYQGKQTFSTARLRTGRGNSGKLVSEVKLALFKHAPQADLAILDGSPGIGCPVISSISGADLVLVVTEPSLSGLSDLERVLRTAAGFQAKTAVCVNKADLSPAHADEIEAFCREHQVPFLGRVPYDRRASEAINAGKSLAEVGGPACEALRKIFDGAMALLAEPQRDPLGA